MHGLTTLPWKAITVLPPLIGASIGTAMIVALRADLSLHLAASLLVCTLAFAEIGYLCLLILVNRRDTARSGPVAPER